MKRREFVKKSIGAGFVTGNALAFGSINNLFAKALLPYSQADLVAVKGGSPGQMFDQGIEVKQEDEPVNRREHPGQVVDESTGNGYPPDNHRRRQKK